MSLKTGSVTWKVSPVAAFHNLMTDTCNEMDRLYASHSPSGDHSGFEIALPFRGDAFRVVYAGILLYVLLCIATLEGAKALLQRHFQTAIERCVE